MNVRYRVELSRDERGPRSLLSCGRAWGSKPRTPPIQSALCRRSLDGGFACQETLHLAESQRRIQAERERPDRGNDVARQNEARATPKRRGDMLFGILGRERPLDQQGEPHRGGQGSVGEYPCNACVHASFMTTTAIVA